MAQVNGIRQAELTVDQLRKAQEFVASFGDEAFELAMASGPLLANLRANSRWAYQTALGAFENGVCVTLLTKLYSSAKRPLERVEHRLVSGDAQLVVDFPHAD